MTKTAEKFVVSEVETPIQLQQFKELAVAYLEWLSEDLHFQGVDDELSTLPGAYSRDNRGAMFIATVNDKEDDSAHNDVGTAAIRPLIGKHVDSVTRISGYNIDEICELKRLFVRPEHQGLGIGRTLVQRVLDEAAALGYKAIVLDTLERLEGANYLYKSMGFVPCEAYSHCPLEGAMYFVKPLHGAADLLLQSSKY
eukprot:jgi/Picsp_1/739/NSC_04228-R1_gcn5-related n-acetyltransferase